MVRLSALGKRAQKAIRKSQTTEYLAKKKIRQGKSLSLEEVESVINSVNAKMKKLTGKRASAYRQNIRKAYGQFTTGSGKNFALNTKAIMNKLSKSPVNSGTYFAKALYETSNINLTESVKHMRSTREGFIKSLREDYSIDVQFSESEWEELQKIAESDRYEHKNKYSSYYALADEIGETFNKVALGDYNSIIKNMQKGDVISFMIIRNIVQNNPNYKEYMTAKRNIEYTMQVSGKRYSPDELKQQNADLAHSYNMANYQMDMLTAYANTWDDLRKVYPEVEDMTTEQYMKFMAKINGNK